MSETRGWELVGGPADGEIVATEYDYPQWRIAKPAPFFVVPPTDIDDIMSMLPSFGEYRAETMRDRRDRVMRWQGWAR
jgi:hypothetical protein